MSLFYAYKPEKDRILHSVSQILLKAGLTPNMVTVAGLFICTIAGLLAMFGHLYVGILLFIFGACLDAVDGSFARACGLCTEFGRYFDSICDRLSELVFVLGAILGGAPATALVVVGGSYVLLVTRIYNHRKGLRSDAAMFGRPERLTLLIVGLLCLAPYNTLLFITAGLLCLISSAQVLVSGIGVKKHVDGSH